MAWARLTRLLCLQSCLMAASIGCAGSQQTPANQGSGSGGTSTSTVPGNGGNSGAGGTSSATGGATSSGGASGSGGASSGGGTSSTGGSQAQGGTVASVGATAAGGASATGGSSGSGGSKATGGATASGGATGSGGAPATGGATATGGSSGTSSCAFTLISNTISSKMATVGVVEWSTTLPNIGSAKIVYSLNNAATTVLSKGGSAPVNLTKTNYRTLLLGLKQASDYTFHIEATSSSGATCKSSDYTLPKTGSLTGAPAVTRTTGASIASQGVGYIVTCSGIGSGGGGGGGGASSAFILDADGAVVWYSAAPSQCSRARMDYEGVNMWMLSLNVQNSGGEMRFVSMDGQTSQTSISGLSSAHHDFTVLPGKIAAMVWTTTGSDPESNLVERASDGSGASTTVFKIGSNLYAGGSSAMGGGSNTYHCNSINYHAADDTFTIGDRNPNLYVKAKHDGTPVWQIGGTCANAKASKCAAGTWQVNHGHDFDANGNLLIFNNGSSGSAHIWEFKVTESTSAIAIATVKDFTSSNTSNTLGDVQRLPNGNTVITYSNSSIILEVDPSWATVQTLKGSFGYADWRETLYGPPEK